MKIAVYGAGYVGLVSAVCFAEQGHKVVCFDVDENKIFSLQKGVMPIYEPDLDNLLMKHLNIGSIVFTSDMDHAIQFSCVQLIAVGTPPLNDGSADLRGVFSVARKIAAHMAEDKLILIKSTVPVGTTDQVAQIVQDIHNERAFQQNSLKASIVFNPEFLREGQAVHDFMHPDRVIIGFDANDKFAKKIVSELYRVFIDQEIALVWMDKKSAELTKYAANAFLATKISFMNQMSQIAEKFGANINNVKVGMMLDPRIGNHFLNPGCGYGGSCFPKDISALIQFSEEKSVDVSLLHAVEQINQTQKELLYHKIAAFFENNLVGRTIGIWGLAFKPGTDDMRAAPSCTLIDLLLRQGAKLKLYDPQASKNAQVIYKPSSQIHYCINAHDVLEEAEVLVIVTEWPEFIRFDVNQIVKKLQYPLIFDGRNIFDSETLKKYGIYHFGMGCGHYGKISYRNFSKVNI